VIKKPRFLMRANIAQDLGYGQTGELMASLEEVSRLLYSSAASLLTPDS
jgi:hypothetical protein